MPVRRRTNFQLARLFGIRIGVSASWFLVLFVLICVARRRILPRRSSKARRRPPTWSRSAAALGYFVSLILHELGHALMARRLGIGIAGIDLWFFGGLSQMRREPATPGEEFKVAAAGPAVTFLLLVVCAGAGEALSPRRAVHRRRLDQGRRSRPRPALALLGWLAFVNARAVRVQHRPGVPARRRADRAGGDLARHRRPQPRDAGDRPRRPGARAGARRARHRAAARARRLDFDLLHDRARVLPLPGGRRAVVQGALGQRIQHITVADIMDREPVTIPADVTLLDAQEQFFLRYRWPWFAVVDPARHFLGVVRAAARGGGDPAGRPGAAGRRRARARPAGADRRRGAARVAAAAPRASAGWARWSPSTPTACCRAW